MPVSLCPIDHLDENLWKLGMALAEREENCPG
jgi:hypothetical protein